VELAVGLWLVLELGPTLGMKLVHRLGFDAPLSLQKVRPTLNQSGEVVDSACGTAWPEHS
jgi:hypothetical protein